MLPIYVLLAALVAAPSLARAQEAESQDAPPQAEPAPAPPERQAIPRGSRPQGEALRVGTAMRRSLRVEPIERPVLASPSPVEGAPSPPPAEPQSAVSQGESAPPERRAIPRGSRPQGDNPRTGTAIPRRGPPPSTGDGDARVDNRGRTVGVPNRGRTVVVRPPIYNYYYPRQFYPYGYGAFGLGYFYYNPYRWYSYYDGYPGYGYGYYRRPWSSFDIGELRLDVSPRHAQVFVDGYFAGVVDDYDGTFQSLKLDSGTYRIEIMAPGYETLTFDVRITPGQKIRYRGELRRTL